MGDYIGRKALLEYVETLEGSSENKVYEKGMNIVLHDYLPQIVNDVPDADVQEVKHGSWKGLKPDNRGYTEKFQCSECKCITTLYLYQQECDYEYCPNCGAKMDKE